MKRFYWFILIASVAGAIGSYLLAGKHGIGTYLVIFSIMAVWLLPLMDSLID